MRTRVAVIFFFAGLLFNACFCSAKGLWRVIDPAQVPAASQTMHPQHYLVYTLDEATLKLQLTTLSGNANEGQIIDLPMPDGSVKQFKVWQTSMMPAALAAKYPELMTFTGEQVGNPNVTAKLDFTIYGFHAMIFNGSNTSFIDPYNKFHDGYYLVHYKKDETRPVANRMKCVQNSAEYPIIKNNTNNSKTANRQSQRTINGTQLRTYRLALSADNFYCRAATGLTHPTIAQAFSEMTTTMNRINGVYEREFSVTMVFVTNEDTLIWPSATGSINGQDPFAAIDNGPDACIDSNQAVCDRRIGDANYDIGHVFTTGAGGFSQEGVVCESTQKAMSVTGQADPVGDGFSIDYVAHEMGHEYGADHSFNNNVDNSCLGNAVSELAFEPGSGSTIMCYAGICSPDDLQPHSDAYFHSGSLQQIQYYISNAGDVCAVKTATNNQPVGVASFVSSYTIPYQTPFELTAPAITDPAGDTSVTYCWEQCNLGDFGAEFTNTHYYGPIFRSFSPSKSATRIFPTNSMVLSGVLSNAGDEDDQGEKAPDVARFLTFRLTIRDIYQGNGCFIIPDDTVHLDAINTGEGFTVTSQNTTGLYYIGSSPETITWNVVGTNIAPINTANVDIYMSIDEGNTWSYHIGTFPNSGSAVVILPNPDTDTHAARIKVKGTNNVFFNVNGADFTVTHSLSSDTSILIYPVPAHSVLRMFGGNKGLLNGVIYNAVGQQMWKGQINGETDISVALWARGVYFVKLIDIKNQHTVRKIVVE